MKVTDRGPYGRGRIIDLSWGAAKAIGMLSQGVSTVKVEMIDKPIPYRPEDPKLPHIDFEVAESDYDFRRNGITKKNMRVSHTNMEQNQVNKNIKTNIKRILKKNIKNIKTK